MNWLMIIKAIYPKRIFFKYIIIFMVILPNAAVQVRARVWKVGFVVDKVAPG
jgi:hypothetical protein